MKIFKRLLLMIMLLLLVGVAFFILIKQKLEQHYVISNKIEFVLPKGSSLNQTANILEKHGVIEDARLFVLYARLNKIADRLKAGEYEISGSVSIETIAKMLVDGKVVVRAVTIPEGKALVEIIEIVKNNPYLSGDITLKLKEGEILPETYHFVRGESRDSILNKARQAMKNVLKEAFLNRDKNIPIKSEEEMLILASIVEKETGVPSERAKVASVFVNRLNIGMKLQTDPTVIYAVTNGQMNLGRPIYKRDLAYDSPYNTYVYAGLPPAPICSPGREAIKAVAHPDNTKYLYFVADGVTGGHRFAKTLNEHNHNVSLYRKAVK